MMKSKGKSVMQRKQALDKGVAGVPIFYRNPFTKEARPILIRPATAISQAPSNNFPSPRQGMSDGPGGTSNKNFEIMPHFSQDAEGRGIDSKDYDEANFQGIVKRHKVRAKRHASIVN